MSVFSDQWLVRLATVGVLAAALGLSACGRKGPLDPPPSAAIPAQERVPDQAPAVAEPVIQPGQGSSGQGSYSIVGRESIPAAPPPSGRGGPFFLDWLLN